MRWDCDCIYLLYANSIVIYNAKEKVYREQYVDIVVGSHKEKIIDMVISNLIHSERAAVIHLKDKLLFSIVPFAIATLPVVQPNSIAIISSRSR